MDAENIAVHPLPFRVSTRREIRLQGWLFFVPTMVLMWLITLAALGVVVANFAGMLRDVPNVAVVFGVGIPIIGFALIHFTTGWAFDFLATYEVTTEGITKRSPFWWKRILWEQTGLWSTSGGYKVWWLFSHRRRHLIAIDWHFLPSHEAELMRSLVFDFLRPQTQSLLSLWGTQEKVFHYSVWLPLAACTSLFVIAILMVGRFAEGIHSFRDMLWFALLATTAVATFAHAFKMATTRVRVKGDRLTLREGFKRAEVNLQAVTELRVGGIPPKHLCFGIWLISGTTKVFLSNDLQDFAMLMLYLARHLAPPWGELARSIASATLEVNLEL